MKTLTELQQNRLLQIQETGPDGGWGYIFFPGIKKPAVVIFSWGGGWDHVSVSYRNRCCTWEEMCQVKDIFFHDNECAVQYHPPKEKYVNNHPHCLHLWMPQEQVLPMPPSIYVGLKGK